MTAAELLNQKYMSLCSQLGDLILKKEQSELLIDKIKSEIKALDASFPMLQELKAAEAAIASREAFKAFEAGKEENVTELQKGDKK